MARRTKPKTMLAVRDRSGGSRRYNVRWRGGRAEAVYADGRVYLRADTMYAFWRDLKRAESGRLFWRMWFGWQRRRWNGKRRG